MQTHSHTNKNTHLESRTYTHTHKTILLNHRTIIQPVETIAGGNESNERLYFPPSTPHVFLFSLLRQLLERMRRQERQIYGMINYRHWHFLCQQYGLYSTPRSCLWVCFSLPLFSPSLVPKRKTERVMVRRLCALCEDGVLGRKVEGCGCCQRVRLKVSSSCRRPGLSFHFH